MYFPFTTRKDEDRFSPQNFYDIRRWTKIEQSRLYYTIVRTNQNRFLDFFVMRAYIHVWTPVYTRIPYKSCMKWLNFSHPYVFYNNTIFSLPIVQDIPIIKHTTYAQKETLQITHL